MAELSSCVFNGGSAQIADRTANQTSANNLAEGAASYQSDA
jgi:hypothetical protein